MLRRLLGKKFRATLSLALALALVGACGGGGSTTAQGFFLQAIGTGGGVAAAGDVYVTIPAGALTQPTGVGVLLEPGTFPIQPASPDGCLYSYLGPIWCVGPVGQALLVDGVLRLVYDESLIPFGRTESQLVLLVWDNNAAVMRPLDGPDVVHDTVNNRFTFDAYPELGHVAVGIRFCTGNILLQDQPDQGSFKLGDAGSTQGKGFSTLWLVDPSEAQAPSLVDTFGLPFDEFLASPIGTRVLLRSPDFGPVELSLSLWTVPLGVPGTAERVASDDPDAGLYLTPYDPLFGWVLAPPGDNVFYTTHGYPVMGQSTASFTESLGLWRRQGDASAPAVLLHYRDGGGADAEDLRQSYDGGVHVIQRDYNWLFGFDTTDVLASPTVSPLLSDDLIPGDTTWPSAQFFHGAGALAARAGAAPAPQRRIYVITSFEEVQTFDLDGTYVDSYFVDDSKVSTTLRHFTVAPDDEHWAAVVDINSFSDVQTGLNFGGTELWMGSFTEDTLATFPLGFVSNVNELVWHPGGHGVFADFGFGWVRYFQLVDDDGFFIEETAIPIPSLTHLDVNIVDGRVLIVVPQWFVEERLVAGGFLEPGLYVSAADPLEFDGPVDLFDEIPDPLNARWVDSWRLQPGQNNARVR